MAQLTLKQSQAIDELVLLLVDWLPGSSPWGTYTFASAAAENHVEAFWPGGSKRRALTELLTRTYGTQPGRFCGLVLTIVRRGQSNRRQHGSPVFREDIEQLNAAIARLAFKVPELWDREFLDDLPRREKVEQIEAAPAVVAPLADPRSEMPALQDRFLSLHADSDRARAGREFEKLLQALLGAWRLSPSGNYRTIGEEIDNSFILDGVTFLVEAKWLAGRTEAAALYTFRQKVASKSAYTRGLFVAVEGFTSGSVSALGTGQEQRIILLDGAHLMRVLSGAVSLPDLLRLASRHLEQFGDPLLPHVRMSELS